MKLSASVAILLLITASPSVADPIADFYHGKQLQILVASGAGGGYDINARLVGRHIGKYIPGNPTIVVINMPGGGSLRATNFVYNVAPHDGSVIGAPSRAIISMPLMGVEAAKYDPTKFGWIGSVTDEVSACVALTSAAVHSWDDLLQKKIIVGGSGPGSDTYINAVMVRNLFGAQFELVAGYLDGKAVQLAMEKGEVDADCGSYSSLKTEQPGWIRDKIVSFLVMIGLERHPDLPDIPTVMELARSDQQRAVLKILLAQQQAGRPMMTPPDVPADRLATLRTAFDETMKDPEFRADAKRLGLEVNPAGGAQLQKLLDDIYASPPDLVERAKRAIDKPEDIDQIRKELAAEGVVQ